MLRHDSDKKVCNIEEVLSVSLKELRKCQHNDQDVLHFMKSDVLQDGAGPKKRERFVVEDGSDRSSRVTATKKVRSGKDNQNVIMKDAVKEDWDVNEESSGKEVSISWRRSDSQDGGLPIHGALAK